MPNNMRQDYVAPHVHSPDDVPGLARAVLGPPTAIAVGVTSNPTSTSSTYADLAEMTETVTPPTNYALWQVTTRFTGTFAHTVLGDTVGIRLTQDGVVIPATTRTASVPSAGGTVTLEVEATVNVDGGVASVFKTQWANVTNAGTATASTTLRRQEVSMKPVTGV